MPGVLDLRIFGVQEVNQMLANGGRAARNMKPALNLVADDLMKRVIAVNFSSEGRRGGGSWKHLQEETIKRKLAAGESIKILVATGALRDSMTVRDHSEQYLHITNRYLELSSYLPYAVVQDEGGGRSDLPARPFVEFLESDVFRWANICERYLIDAMRI